MKEKLLVSATLSLLLFLFCLWQNRHLPKQDPALAAIPKTIGATVPPVSTELESDTKTPAAPEIPTEEWVRIGFELENLANDDQTTLDSLYSQMHTAIQEHGPEVLRHLRADFPRLVAAPLTHSFFYVGAWIRSSPDPTAIIRVLRSYQPESSSERDAPGKNRVVKKYEQIQAYAFRELGNRFRQDSDVLNSPHRSELVAHLSQLSASVKSHNLLLESTLLLQQMGESETLKSVLRQRTDFEREMVLTMLAGT